MMEQIEKGFYYHIYNRGAGKADIFFNLQDYHRFLDLYFYYLFPCLHTYAWCLLRNHFHALVKVKTLEEQVMTYRQIQTQSKQDDFHGSLNPADKPYSVSKQLSHLFNSYTKKINVASDRSGTLIEGPLKRIRLNSESHFIHLLCYIHRNPIHHRITDNYTDYLHSSIHDYLKSDPTLINKKKALEMFGGLPNFIRAHKEFKYKIDWKKNKYLE